MAAASPPPPPLLLFLFFSVSYAYISNNALTFPVTKHPSSFHYATKIHLGSGPGVPVNVLIDLGSPFTWANCASRSSSPRLIPCRSIQCSTAKAHDCALSWFGSTCGSPVGNPITGETTRGALTADVITNVDSSHGSLSSDPIEFLYYCVTNSLFFRGLPSGLGGVLGLGGDARTSAASQLAMGLSLPRKFSVCLSPSGGRITVGESPSPSTPLTYTPLVPTLEGAYFIIVNGVKINGERVNVKARTKLSTTAPYTVMKTALYNSFVKAYTEAAETMNMTRMAETAPFRICYGGSGNSGPRMPEVELVLQSEMVKWKIKERNLMVKTGKEVICLGILEAGLNNNLKEEEEMVIGVHQLEDELLEFDQSSSMLGFSSSSSSCSGLIGLDSSQSI